MMETWWQPRGSARRGCRVDLLGELAMRPLIAGIVLVLAAVPARADDLKPPAAKAAVAIQVPYSLTATQHVLVRVKLNGKGPYNFILDTGAPVLFIATKIAEKAGVTADKQ